MEWLNSFAHDNLVLIAFGLAVWPLVVYGMIFEKNNAKPPVKHPEVLPPERKLKAYDPGRNLERIMDGKEEKYYE